MCVCVVPRRWRSFNTYSSAICFVLFCWSLHAVFFSHSRSIVWFHIRSSSSVRCFGWTIRQKLKIEARILHLKRSDHQWKWTGIVSGALAYFMWHGMSPINWASTGMHLLSAEAFHKWFRAVWTIDSVNTHYCQYWSSAWNAIVHAHDCTTAIFI